MKILLLDIESAPNTVHCWGIFQQDIALNQILESSYVLCWSAKWLDDGTVTFRRTTNPAKGSTKPMIQAIHKLLDQADMVVTYNGIKFDLPTLNKEFILHGLSQPAPYKQLDLLRVARAQFRFTSNKLDYVAQALGLGKKREHEGHLLWVRCMAGDRGAWKRMEAYNKQDVLLLEKLYHRLLPWIKTHPNQSLYAEKMCCPTCGHSDYQRRGYARTTVGKYQRYQCRKCGSWFRGTKTLLRKGERVVSL